MVDRQIRAPCGIAAILAAVPVAPVNVMAIKSYAPWRTPLVMPKDDHHREFQRKSRCSKKRLVRCGQYLGTLDPSVEIEGLIIVINDLSEILIKQTERAPDGTDMHGEPLSVEDEDRALG